MALSCAARVLGAVLLVLFAALTCFAQTIHVNCSQNEAEGPFDGTSAAPFPSIHAALDAASAGATILVAPGVCRVEPMSPIMINTSLQLECAEPPPAALDGHSAQTACAIDCMNQLNCSLVRVVGVGGPPEDAPRVSILGFTLRGAALREPRVITCLGKSVSFPPVVEASVLDVVNSTVLLRGVVVRDNTIGDNILVGLRGDVSLSALVLENCAFVDNIYRAGMIAAFPADAMQSTGALGINRRPNLVASDSLFMNNTAVATRNVQTQQLEMGSLQFLRPPSVPNFPCATGGGGGTYFMAASTGLGSAVLVLLMGMRLERCRFMNNLGLGAGAIHALGIQNVVGVVPSGMLVEIRDSVFEGNIARSWIVSNAEGGAIKVLNEVELVIGGSTFRQNRVEALLIVSELARVASVGGAVAAGSRSGMWLNITDSVFEGHEAHFGGAVFVGFQHVRDLGEATYLYMRNATFRNNTAVRFDIPNYAVATSQMESVVTIDVQVKDGLGGGLLIHSMPNVFMESVIMEENRAHWGGAAFIAIAPGSRATPKQLFMRNLVLRWNSAIYGGGVALESGMKTLASSVSGVVQLIIEDGRFENNTADNGGAVWMSSDFNVTMNRTVLAGNRAELYGGAVQRDMPFYPVAIGVVTSIPYPSYEERIYQPSAAVRYLHGALVLDSCLLVNNTAAIGGGHLGLRAFPDADSPLPSASLFSSSDEEPSLALRITLMSNSTLRGGGGLLGGAVYASDDTHILMWRCHLEDNAAVLGGAVWIGRGLIDGSQHGAQGLLIDSIMRGNHAVKGLRGAAVTAATAALSALKGSGIGSADGCGGALFVGPEGRVNVTGRNFVGTGNFADSNGGFGCLYGFRASDGTTFDADMLILGATDAGPLVSQNSAPYAGAIRIEGFASLSVVGAVHFVNNSASAQPSMVILGTASEGGGALQAVGPFAHVHLSGGALFEANRAELSNGGALCILQARVDVEGVVFRANYAFLGGGAAYIFAAAAVQLRGNTILEGNICNGRGGALLVRQNRVRTTIASEGDGRVLLEDSTFSNNTATLGGAVYTQQDVDPIERPLWLTVRRCTFRRNRAFRAGALRASLGLRLVAEQCVFEKNQALILEELLPRLPSPTSAINQLRVTGLAVLADSSLLTGNISTPNVGPRSRYPPAQGGALWLHPTSNVTLDHCTLESNKATPGLGGAMFTSQPVDGGLLRLSGTTSFMRNEASGGGALFAGRRQAILLESIHDGVEGGVVLLENRADYGENEATEGTTLVWDPPFEQQMVSRSAHEGTQLPNNTVRSGDEAALSVALLDVFGQRVAWSGYPLATAVSVGSADGSDDNISSILVVLGQQVEALAEGPQTLFHLTVLARPSTFSVQASLFSDSDSVLGERGSDPTVDEYFSAGDGGALSTANVLLTIVGNITVVDCTAGQFLQEIPISTFLVCIECPINTYNLQGSTPCLPCEEGAVCEGGQIKALPDHFLFFPPGAARAEVGECAPGLCRGENLCAPHHVGPLCGECEDAYIMVNNLCVHCTHVDAGAVLLRVFLFIGFVLYLTLYRKNHSANLTIFIFYVQTAALLFSEVLPRDKGAGTPFRDWMGTVFSLLNLENLSEISNCVGPINFYERFWLTLLSPLFFFVAYATVYWVEKYLCGGSIASRLPRWVATRLNLQPKRKRYRIAALIIAIFVYAPITHKVLAMMSCKETYAGSGDFRLRADTTIECTGTTYDLHFAISVLLAALYVYPFPLLMYIFVRYQLRRAAQVGKESGTTFSSIFEIYKSRYHYWEVVMQLRRALLVTLIIFIEQRADRLLVVSSLLVLLTAAQSSLRPFATVRGNLMEGTSLWVLTAMVCMLSSQWYINSHEGDAIVIAMVCLVPLPLLVALLDVLLVRSVAAYHAASGANSSSLSTSRIQLLKILSANLGNSIRHSLRGAGAAASKAHDERKDNADAEADSRAEPEQPRDSASGQVETEEKKEDDGGRGEESLGEPAWIDDEEFDPELDEELRRQAWLRSTRRPLSITTRLADPDRFLANRGGSATRADAAGKTGILLNQGLFDKRVKESVDPDFLIEDDDRPIARSAPVRFGGALGASSENNAYQ